MLVAGDASAAYRWANPHSKPRVFPTGLKKRDFLFPGLSEYLCGLDASYRSDLDAELVVGNDSYNPVKQAVRTLLMVRGKRPYLLCVDDFEKDGTPRNYRWFMNCAKCFYPEGDPRFINEQGGNAYSSLAIESATATRSVLYHHPIDAGRKAGQPRLLVLDLQAVGADQPAMRLETRPPQGQGGGTVLTPAGHGQQHQAIRVRADQPAAHRPHPGGPPGLRHPALPVPDRESEPTAAWNQDRTLLSIDAGGGQVDRISFDRTRVDGRTRLTFTRGAVR